MPSEELKTLREVITLAWERMGRKGQPTREFIAQWREDNPTIGWNTLNARLYRTGLSVRPEAFETDPDCKVTRPIACIERELARERKTLAAIMAGNYTLPVGCLPGTLDLVTEHHRARIAELEETLRQRLLLSARPRTQQ